MKKYNVYASGWYSVHLGEYEAEDSETAIEMADMDDQANWLPSLCHQCSREVELSDFDRTDAYEVDG